MKSTSKSLAWSVIDKFGVQVFALVVGVISARLLSPNDFGIVACLAVFTALSNALVDSGFSIALIRRDQNSDNDYAAIFFFNVIFGVALYLLLLFFSKDIARYFNTPQIVPLSRVIFISIILNAFGIVQNIIFTRNMRFDYISISNLTSAVFSAVLTIVLIYMGYGYWSIAWQQVSLVAVRVVMMWILGSWRPVHKPDFRVIKEIFGFSYFLLVTNIINMFVKYIYNLKIPKIFSNTELGYYDRARKFEEIPSVVVSSSIISVAYPVLSSLNNDKPAQVAFFRKVVRITAFLIFPIMFGLVGVIDNLTIVVLKDKWLPMVPFFRVLCVAGVFLPFQQLCFTAINAVGRSKLNFYLELFRNALVILFFILFSSSVIQMVWGFSIAMVIAYITNILVVGRFFKYSFFDHIKDIFPYFVISLGIYLFAVWVGTINIQSLIVVLFLQIFLSAILYFVVVYLLGSKVIKECLELIKHFTTKK